MIALQSQAVAAIAEETSAGGLEVTSATEEQSKSIEHIDQLSAELKEQSQQLHKMIQQFDRTTSEI